MANHIVMKGRDALLRWGYATAATLGAWTIEDGRLTAVVVNRDAFRVAQRPLTFVVSRPATPARPAGACWEWAITELQITATEMRARLVQEEGALV